jgi:ribonuclease VapC
MVIDTSALIAILLREADRDLYIEAIEKASVRVLSAVNALEAAIVVEARKGPAGGRELDLLLHRGRIDVIAMDGGQVEESRRVWREYGKGNHPAGLNFCDCCAMALARITGYPLLFKGADFARTNAVSAIGGDN